MPVPALYSFGKLGVYIEKPLNLSMGFVELFVSCAHHHFSGLATNPAASSSALATWNTVASSRALPMT